MKAVVVCPGRGSYNRTELGHLARFFPDAALLDRFDQQRSASRQPTLRELDGAKRFSIATHTRGDNASALIFAASLGDFLSIDREAVEVVAVTGNSMGWYSTLACAGAVTHEDGFRIANTMGTLMQRAPVGGQLVYPFVEEDWTVRPDRRSQLLALVDAIGSTGGNELWLSIDLGGMLVLAGNEEGLAAFERMVEPLQQRYPLRLPNHAAFHTPLMRPVADLGRQSFEIGVFSDPKLPMIDGRGAIWWPRTCDPAELRAYTLGTQVTHTYDFTKAVTVAAREFAPDIFIVLGPGATMGGAVAQSLVFARWRGMAGKSDFRARQNADGLLASTGVPDQRQRVVRAMA